MEVIATGLAFPEGPVVMDDGSVILVEIQRGTLTRVSPSGDVDVIADLGGGPNGAALGPDGHCYVCNNGGFKWYTARDGRVFPGDQPDDYVNGSIQRVNLSTGAFDTIYDQCEGEPLKGPNDLVFDRTGGFWFTDHGKSRPRDRDRTGVFYARPDGSMRREAAVAAIDPAISGAMGPSSNARRACGTPRRAAGTTSIISAMRTAPRTSGTRASGPTASVGRGPDATTTSP